MWAEPWESATELVVSLQKDSCFGIWTYNEHFKENVFQPRKLTNMLMFFFLTRTVLWWGLLNLLGICQFINLKPYILLSKSLFELWNCFQECLCVGPCCSSHKYFTWLEMCHQNVAHRISNDQLLLFGIFSIVITELQLLASLDIPWEKRNCISIRVIGVDILEECTLWTFAPAIKEYHFSFKIVFRPLALTVMSLILFFNNNNKKGKTKYNEYNNNN